MKKIYVVMGDTGEYSDATTWATKAFACREDADRFCKMLNDWCVEQGVHTLEMGRTEYDVNYEGKCELDPDFQADYTGTCYNVLEVERGEPLLKRLGLKEEPNNS